MGQTSNVSTDERRFTHLRRHPRVRISAPFPCSFVLVGLNRRHVVKQGDVGIVYDVSTKGARMMTEAVISPGDRIEISLRLPHHASPTVIEHATVRWGRAQTYGVEFEGLSLVADSRLQKFMARAAKLAPVSPL
jgi:hypothetical protein